MTYLLVMQIWVFQWTPKKRLFQILQQIVIECEIEFDGLGLKYKCFNKSFIHTEHLYSGTSKNY